VAIALLGQLLVAKDGRAGEGQLGIRAAIESDLRWRGYTLSAGDPVASVDVTYVDLSGLYISGAAIGQWRGDEARYLGFTANAGYAARIGDRWSLDAGLERAQYRPAYRNGPGYRYTQLYVGLTRAPVLARVSYSPDYLSGGAHALYFESEGSLDLARSLRLLGHAGALAIIARPVGSIGPSARYDWRLGLSRSFGSAEVHVNLSGGGPPQQYYRGAEHDRTAMTIGASFNF
jgi:uncharacterized protein (TIGR02001 family)